MCLQKKKRTLQSVMVSLQKKTVDEINSKYARESNRTLSIMMNNEECSTINGMLVFKYWYYKYNDQIFKYYILDYLNQLHSIEMKHLFTRQPTRSLLWSIIYVMYQLYIIEFDYN